MRRLMFAVLALFSLQLQAFTFEAGDIDVPAGFEGPNAQQMGEGMVTTAFAYPHEGEDTSALLQITVWNPGRELPEMDQSEQVEASKAVLMQFIAGVAKARREFSVSDIEVVTVSDIPVTKIQWRGAVNKGPAEGVMYSYIHNSRMVVLHTQDLARYDREYIDLAVNAIESMNIR